MQIYKGKITKLGTNQIFVFGSNTQGRHGKGAALYARKYFGAIYGRAKGLQGKSYAIVTKDLTKKQHPSITKEYIIEQIDTLYEFAKINKHLEFFIVYSGDGINLNGYTNKEMALMFKREFIPDNIVFEESFYKLMNEYSLF